jgi:hypothetical protein
VINKSLFQFEQFAPIFMKVKKREGGTLVPFHLKLVQQQIIERLHQNTGRLRKILILKSRRLGSSTGIAGYFLHKILFTPHLRGMVVAHRGPDAAVLFSIYERFYEHIPDSIAGVPLKPKRTGSRGNKMQFHGIDSALEVSSASTPEAGRGGDAQLIHLSEVAFYPDPEFYLGALLPQIPLTGNCKLVLESTADGPAGFFYDVWKRSATEDITEGYETLFFPWFVDADFRLDYAIEREEWNDEECMLNERFGVDGHQLAWLRDVEETICFGNERMRRREYPSTPEDAFSSVEHELWDAQLIMGVYHKMPPEWEGLVDDRGIRKAKSGPLKVWQKPQEGQRYVIGADPAGGFENGDWSVAMVFHVHKQAGSWPVQVASLAVKEDPVTFAKTLSILGHYYNIALLAVEVTGLGRGTQTALQNVYYYPDLHRWIPFDRYKSNSDTWGWETTWKSKQVMIGLTDWLLRTQHVILRDPELVEELMFFRQIAGTDQFEGARGDDRVMAFMIAVTSWFQHLYPGIGLSELRDMLHRIHGGQSARRQQGVDDPQEEPMQPLGTRWGEAVGRMSRRESLVGLDDWG